MTTSVRPEYGYDRIARGLSEYYRKGGGRRIHVRVVGPASERALSSVGLRSGSFGNCTVEVLGYLVGEALDHVVDMSHFGLGLSGGHRVGWDSITTLKGPEFLARGLPVITATPFRDIGPNCRYCKLVPDHPEPVDITQVLEFYDDIYGNESEESIAWQARAYAEDHLSMAISLRPVIEYATAESSSAKRSVGRP
jgi:hypothetical protein